MARSNFFQRVGRALGNILGIGRGEGQRPEPAPPVTPAAPPPPYYEPEPQIPTEPPPPQQIDEPIEPPSMFDGGGGISDSDYIGPDDERDDVLDGAAEDFVDYYGDDFDGINVTFDGDFEIGDYDIGERTVHASFYGDAAAEFLANPSYSAVFENYSSGSGFSASQWLGGMGTVSNMTIDRL